MPRREPLGTEQFATNLRARRTAANLTQEDLAHRAGIHPTQVSRLERRKRNPGLSMIVRLGRALDIPPARLLDGIN